MAVAVVKSRALNGMNAPEMVVEAHLATGLSAFTRVGLPETEMKEARDRVCAAIQNARFEFPARRITVNLAPADLPKEYGRFDLPIALAILAASGPVAADKFKQAEFASELALTGELRPVRGALAMARATRHPARPHRHPDQRAGADAGRTDAGRRGRTQHRHPRSRAGRARPSDDAPGQTKRRARHPENRPALHWMQPAKPC